MVSLDPGAALFAFGGLLASVLPAAFVDVLAQDPATMANLQVLFLQGLIDFLYTILELVWLITRIFSLIGGGGG